MSSFDLWRQHAQNKSGLQVAIATIKKSFKETVANYPEDVRNSLRSMHDRILAHLQIDLNWAEDGEKFITKNGEPVGDTSITVIYGLFDIANDYNQPQHLITWWPSKPTAQQVQNAIANDLNLPDVCHCLTEQQWQKLADCGSVELSYNQREYLVEQVERAQ